MVSHEKNRYSRSDQNGTYFVDMRGFSAAAVLVILSRERARCLLFFVM
jgi:hypothetical protein